jgi:hypothetical protein
MIARFSAHGLSSLAWSVALPTAGLAQESSGERFVKVFDVVDSGFKDWAFPAFGLIFVAIGIVIAIFPNIVRAVGIPYLNVRSKAHTILGYCFAGFAILWTVTSFDATYTEYRRHKTLAEENRCRLVEGPVEHFLPMPYGGHAAESFSVDGVTFRYSDFIVTDGFNNTSSHGGPVHGDSYVRICYDPSNDAILRLEIRDFKGGLKDYAKAQSIFPKPAEMPNIGGRNPAINIPWYGNLFLVLYILDFIGIYALYLPYIRTFVRIGSVAVRDCSVPAKLEAGQKSKLRNSTIYWDREGRAIWLRPRGFNFVQIQLTVAKLNLDIGGSSIDEYEIRFSSGALLVTALLLSTAYVVFSAASSTDADLPSPIIFVGITAVLFLVGGFFHLRMLRSRMNRLVEDALSEFRGMERI